MMTTIPPRTATTNDLRDEVAARKEAELWNLKPCPCCHAKATVLDMKEITIACSRYGCRQVKALTMIDAAYLWNQPDFRNTQRRD